MNPHRLIGLGATVFLLCDGVAHAQADVHDAVAALDATAPRYQASNCVSARNDAMAYSDHVGARIAGGVALGAAFGLAALPFAAGIDAKQAKERKAMLYELISGCGSEALLAYVKNSSLDTNSNVQTWLGYGYASEQEWPEAIDWYKRAAAQHNEEAEAALGGIYYAGKGVTPDYAVAESYWRQGSDDGSSAAKVGLARMYVDGKGVAQDYDQAYALDFAAARMGDAEAQFSLGDLYETGRGTAKSDREAYKWYVMSSLNGDADAAAKRDALANRLSSDSIHTMNAKALRCRSSGYQRQECE